MPDSLMCPHCHRVGFVRCETVITGHRLTRTCACGACDHVWITPLTRQLIDTFRITKAAVDYAQINAERAIARARSAIEVSRQVREVSRRLAGSSG